MDSELRAYLEGMEERIVDRSGQGLEGRLEGMEERIVERSGQLLERRLDGMEERIVERSVQRLEGYLEGMEERIVDRATQRLEGRIDAVEERMKAHVAHSCEEVTTKLLAEFWKWGRMSDIRTRQALENVAAFGERLLNIEDRVTALERRGAS